MKVRNVEKKIFGEHRNLMGTSEIDSKYKYVKLARGLPTFGVHFFLVKVCPQSSVDTEVCLFSVEVDQWTTLHCIVFHHTSNIRDLDYPSLSTLHSTTTHPLSTIATFINHLVSVSSQNFYILLLHYLFQISDSP